MQYLSNAHYTTVLSSLHYLAARQDHALQDYLKASHLL